MNLAASEIKQYFFLLNWILFIYLSAGSATQMQTIVFQYPYERVYKGAKMVLHNKGFSVIQSDHNSGFIKFRKYFLFVIPSIEATLNFNKVDEKNIRVTVSTAAKGIFFRNIKKAARAENRIVEVMTSIIWLQNPTAPKNLIRSDLFRAFLFLFRYEIKGYFF